MRLTGINKSKAGLPPRLQLWLVTAIIIATAAIFSLYTRRAANTSDSMIVVNGKRIMLELADTAEKRSKGLSGRSGLGAGEGMLFVFESYGRQCMWMKDMRFDLDLIWFDEQKRIIEIKENIKPETYPESFCANGKYVLEVNAGMVDRLGLNSNTSIGF